MNGYLTICNSVGKILRVVFCPKDAFLLQVQSNEFGLEMQSNHETQYVDINDLCVKNKINNQSVVNKFVLLANSEDSIVISNLEIPSIITVNDIAYTNEDATFEFSTDLVGEYLFSISSLTQKDKTFTVVAE